MQAKARECKMEISMTFMDIVAKITFPYTLFIRDVVNCARKKNIYKHTMCEFTVSIFLPKKKQQYFCCITVHNRVFLLTFISNKFLTFLHPELRRKVEVPKHTK